MRVSGRRRGGSACKPVENQLLTKFFFYFNAKSSVIELIWSRARWSIKTLRRLPRGTKSFPLVPLRSPRRGPIPCHTTL